MTAIIQTGGKQYLVSSGDKIQVEKLTGEVGDILKFDQVLFTSEGKEFKLGKPTITGAVIEGKILKQARSKKIHVLKYKAKSKYRRKIGARQHYTEVEIVKA
jgi:large subunit ribosomal protein L21